MRVLLTGANGFIGRHLLSQLKNADINTVVVGRSRPDAYKGDYIEADLLQTQCCNQLVQSAEATHLIHLAWYTEHGQYWSSPLNLRWLEASVRLVDSFCAVGGKKVIAAGTCAEYDWEFGFCREDSTPLNPATLYGTAKDATRRLLEMICKNHQTQFVWARMFLPYGKGEDRHRLIPALFEVFQGKRPPFGVNANAYRDFLHVKDVANAFIQLLLSDAEGNYNIASGQPTQIAEIVYAIANVFNSNPHVVLDLSSNRPGEPEILIGDSQKLRMLGWHPMHSIKPICLSQELPFE
ncbi:NAD(P)-dependent oxidoreductase [Azonexus hydrophilus]|jgi:nucleoside-diphosphate-sugar epimerase|uniref:NAD(P)-dependent oxidoreductase n=1 Tax=Azonexus hydrophilus TaxID=418702 RepID=A0ABZ2XI56_9RHOO|nr:NAD(P)-dependent oxidoreductase [Dechloromonas sp.]